MPDTIPLLHGLFWLSVAISVVGTFALPVVILRIPADYFRRAKRPSGPFNWRAWSKIVVHFVRNAVAAVFLVAGIIMLFTPGQGLLMLLAALWLATFPGKRWLERRLIALPGVLNVINKIRSKAGVPPLEAPDGVDGRAGS